MSEQFNTIVINKLVYKGKMEIGFYSHTQADKLIFLVQVIEVPEVTFEFRIYHFDALPRPKTTVNYVITYSRTLKNEYF